MRKHSEETKEKIRIARAKQSAPVPKGTKFSEEHKKRISEGQKGRKPTRYWLGKVSPHMIGSNNPNWTKDRTKLTKNEHKHLDSIYMLWSKNVKDRDNWKCKINNQDCRGRLEAHHILTWKDYPELRYDINNGITLCLAHHPRKRSEEKRLSPYFQELVSVSKEII